MKCTVYLHEIAHGTQYMVKYMVFKKKFRVRFMGQGSLMQFLASNVSFGTGLCEATIKCSLIGNFSKEFINSAYTTETTCKHIVLSFHYCYCPLIGLCSSDHKHPSSYHVNSFTPRLEHITSSTHVFSKTKTCAEFCNYIGSL
jgi:hypothetical protein